MLYFCVKNVITTNYNSTDHPFFHRVSYQIYKAKLKSELIPSR